ncbi:MAG: glycosyltransferase [Rubrivivax sp.]|nr:glycosyltransferase [Rubrivivax sp.]
MNPKNPVIFTVGASKAFLAQAQASVPAQDFADFEVLAVLDGVSAPVQAIDDACRDERVRVIRVPIRLRTSNARSAGLLATRAPHLALIDSDDEGAVPAGADDATRGLPVRGGGSAPRSRERRTSRVRPV